MFAKNRSVVLTPIIASMVSWHIYKKKSVYHVHMGLLNWKFAGIIRYIYGFRFRRHPIPNTSNIFYMTEIWKNILYINQWINEANRYRSYISNLHCLSIQRSYKTIVFLLRFVKNDMGGKDCTHVVKYPFEAPEFTAAFIGVRVGQPLVDNLLGFFFVLFLLVTILTVHWLSFFELRLLITPLVSLNFSYCKTINTECCYLLIIL